MTPETLEIVGMKAPLSVTQRRTTGGRRLNPAQTEELGRILREDPRDHGFHSARWTLRSVQRLVREDFAVDYSTTAIFGLAQRLGVLPLVDLEREPTEPARSPLSAVQRDRRLHERRHPPAARVR